MRTQRERQRASSERWHARFSPAHRCMLAAIGRMLLGCTAAAITARASMLAAECAWRWSICARSTAGVLDRYMPMKSCYLTRLSMHTPVKCDTPATPVQ